MLRTIHKQPVWAIFKLQQVSCPMNLNTEGFSVLSYNCVNWF